jgi:acyl-CoA thioesterase FadM
VVRLASGALGIAKVIFHAEIESGDGSKMCVSCIVDWMRVSPLRYRIMAVERFVLVEVLESTLIYYTDGHIANILEPLNYAGRGL